MWGLLMPWSNVWQRIRNAQRNVQDSNLVGDGFTMGGAMVLRRGDGNGGGDGLLTLTCIRHLELSVLSQVERVSSHVLHIIMSAC